MYYLKKKDADIYSKSRIQIPITDNTLDHRYQHVFLLNLKQKLLTVNDKKIAENLRLLIDKIINNGYIREVVIFTTTLIIRRKLP